MIAFESAYQTLNAITFWKRILLSKENFTGLREAA
jgi:hypothetical protein